MLAECPIRYSGDEENESDTWLAKLLKTYSLWTLLIYLRNNTPEVEHIYLQMCSWILFWTHYFSSRIIWLFQYHKIPPGCSQLLLSCILILTVSASHEVYILVFVLHHSLFWNKSYYLFHSLDRIARWHKQEYLIGLSKNKVWRRPWKK